MRNWITLMSVLLALAACATGEPPAVPAVTPPDPPTVLDRHPDALDCAYARPDVVPEDREEVVLDVVALPTYTLTVGRSVRTPADASPADTVLYFAKHGLVVRRNTTVEISVPEEARGQLYLRWEGVTKELVDRVIEEAESGWIWFVGGYWVTEPGCYPITVASQGRSQEVHLSIGVPCSR